MSEQLKLGHAPYSDEEIMALARAAYEKGVIPIARDYFRVIREGGLICACVLGAACLKFADDDPAFDYENFDSNSVAHYLGREWDWACGAVLGFDGSELGESPNNPAAHLGHAFGRKAREEFLK